MSFDTSESVSDVTSNPFSGFDPLVVERLYARAVELEKSNQAISEITEILARAEGIEEIVPATLNIIARAFGAPTVGYYEVDATDMVFLRYWLTGDKVLSPAELLSMEDLGDHLSPKLLAKGFTVPEDYLGVAVGQRPHSNVIDHYRGTSQPAFDAWALKHDLGMELNVPLVVAQRSIGIITLRKGRSEGRGYSDNEIALAETVAKQLTLAIQAANFTTNLAAKDVENALARERERAAVDRAEELAKANAALTDSLRQIEHESDSKAVAGIILRQIAHHAGAQLCHWLKYDPVANTLETVLRVKDDALLEGPEADEPAVFSKPFPADITGAFQFLLGTDELIQLSTAADSPMMWPGTTEWHRRNGRTEALASLVRVGDQPVGVLGMGFVDRASLTDSQKQLIRALCNNLGLALRLTQLGEEAKRAAVGKEREAALERRAEELSRSSQAIRKAVDYLAGDPELLRFVGQVLTTVGEQLPAPVVEYWSHDGKDTAFLVLTCREGRIFTGSDMPNDVRVRGIHIPPRMTGESRLSENKTHFILEDLAEDPVQQSVFQPLGFDLKQWCMERGVQKHINVPLIMGDHSFGSVCAYVPARQEFDESKIELAYSLAQQVALAIRMTELSEQSKDVALATERERASQVRAAELAKANQALSRSVGRLINVQDLDSFLDSVLLESVRASGAVSGAIFLCHQDANSLLSASHVIRGELLDLKHDERWHAFRDPIPVRGNLAWEIIGINREIFWMDYSDPDPRDWPQSKAFHDANGHRFVAAIPMLQGNRALGFMGLAYDKAEVVQPTESRLELCRVLAQQAALAVHLTHLAKQSEEAAAQNERRKADEQRAAELIEINAALSLRSRLLTVVAEVSTQLAQAESFVEAIGEALKRIGEAADLGRVLVLVRNKGFDGEESRHIVFAEWTAVGVATHADKGITEFKDVDAGQLLDILKSGRSYWLKTSEINEPLRSIFENLSIHCTGGVPLLMDKQYAGAIAFDQCKPRPWDPVNVDALTAAGNAISAAFQAHKSGERLKERAAELTRVNSSIRANLLQLSDGSSLHDVMERLLISAVEQLNAKSSCIFLYDEGNHTLERSYTASSDRMGLGVSDGEAFDACPRVVPADVSSLWSFFVDTRKPVLLDMAQQRDAEVLWAGAVRWHIDNGQPLAYGVPLYSNDRALGFIGFNFGPEVKKEDFSSDHVNLAESLASLASMALETHQLSLRARDAAVAEERARISGEMHDGVQQIFTAISFQLGTLSNIATKAGVRDILLPQIERTAEIAEEGVREVRRSIRALRDIAPLSEQELIKALQAICQSGDSDRTRCSITIESKLNLPTSARLNEIHRIAQEAVGNVYRHANASRVQITMKRLADSLHLTITDDGHGFEKEQHRSSGLGLRSMEQRAKRLGGSVNIHSSSAGTTVDLFVPRIELI